ncbi:MAG: hypothetical protein AAGF23_03000 [Acidobacteriota bacterium]
MDPERMKEAYQRLEALDERLSYKIRPKGGYLQPSADQINHHVNDVANYVLELKDILRELMLSFATRRQPPAQPGSPPQTPPQPPR